MNYINDELLTHVTLDILTIEDNPLLLEDINERVINSCPKTLREICAENVLINNQHKNLNNPYLLPSDLQTYLNNCKLCSSCYGTPIILES